MYPFIIAGVTAAIGGLYFAYTGCCTKRKNKIITQPQTPIEVLSLFYAFETAFSYLDINKTTIGTEGILRQGGSVKKIDMVYDFMIHNQKLLPISTAGANTKPFYDVHDVIGALKKVMKDFLKPELFDGQTLFSQLKTAHNNDIAHIYKEHIQNLIYQKTDDREGRILHNLIRLCFNIQKNQATTLMTPQNIANVLVPTFLMLFGQPAEAALDAKISGRVNTIIQTLVANNMFSDSFAATHYSKVRPRG